MNDNSPNNNGLYFVVGGLVAVVAVGAFFFLSSGQHVKGHRGDHDAAIQLERHDDEHR